MKWFLLLASSFLSLNAATVDVNDTYVEFPGAAITSSTNADQYYVPKSKHCCGYSPYWGNGLGWGSGWGWGAGSWNHGWHNRYHGWNHGGHGHHGWNHAGHHHGGGHHGHGGGHHGRHHH